MDTARLALNILLLLATILSASAQTTLNARPERIAEYTQEIVPDNFDTLLFRDAVLFFCNKELKHLGYRTLEPHQALTQAAQPYSLFLAESGESKPGLGGKKQALSYRLSLSGGALPNTEEIAGKFAIAKGKEKLYYDTVAVAIVYKWFNSKYLETIANDNLVYIGIGASIGTARKKVYIDVILGNYSSINKGADLVSKHPLLATTTNYKLLPYDQKICKGTKKIKNLQRFQQNLTVDSNRTIYFETEEYKQFSKLLKLSQNAIAVDILQKSQFECSHENIIDYSLPSRGYMLRPIRQTKIEKLNQITGKEAKYKCRIPLGSLPSSISENYELSLVIIQEKHACANITQSFVHKGESKTQINLGILADTVTAFNRFSTHYTPEPDTTVLEFRIPFELGKSDYNPDDIKPFIEALNEPDFIVNSLKIEAFSSIEGEEATNEKLRKKRAENIFDAFKKMNPTLETADITTSDSWAIFKTDIQSTAYDTLATMSRATATEYIKKHALQDTLENILSKHRFAHITMEVIYDISGLKEKAFVLKKFEEALAEGKLSKALSIEKYVMSKIIRRQYPPNAVHEIQIPLDSARFSGMELNRLWLEYRIENKPIDTVFFHHVQRMLKQSPKNDYIRFNHAYCRVLFDTIREEATIDEIQREIDALQTSSLSKEKIDPLNLKFQLLILNSINETFEPQNEKQLTESILEKLKSIVELTDENSKQALSLAYLFIDMKDYRYASTILQPFIESQSANEEMIFTYLSLCSQLENKHQTRIFEKAIKQAYDWNSERLCSLFADHKFSYLTLENPNVKELICTKCISEKKP